MSDGYITTRVNELIRQRINEAHRERELSREGDDNIRASLADAGPLVTDVALAHPTVDYQVRTEREYKRFKDDVLEKAHSYFGSSERIEADVAVAHLLADASDE